MQPLLVIFLVLFVIWTSIIYIFSPGGDVRSMETKCIKAGGFTLTDNFGTDFKYCEFR